MKYSSDYPIPSITTTTIITQVEKVLLIKRGKEPFKGLWAFPGGFFNQFESARNCCIREVLEETGIDISGFCPSRPINVISNATRDPRGWVIDCPFYIRLPDDFNVENCKGQDDAVEAKWFHYKEVDKMKLAFDHNATYASIRNIYQ